MQQGLSDLKPDGKSLVGNTNFQQLLCSTYFAFSYSFPTKHNQSFASIKHPICCTRLNCGGVEIVPGSMNSG